MSPDELQSYIDAFGEKYRTVIEDALEWLENREPTWGLEKPMDRMEFLRDILGKVKK